MSNAIYDVNDKPSIRDTIIFGAQQAAACFASTILVPILVGLPISNALFTAGIGTLLYLIICGAFKKDGICSPLILGSSFSFIAPLQMVLSSYGFSYAMGGILASGLFYVIIAALISKFGTEWIHKILPKYVVGAIIISIGMNLAPTAVNMAMNLNGNYSMEAFTIAMVTLIATIIPNVCFKGYVSTIPILIGIIVGYLFTLIMGTFIPSYKLIDFSIINSASLFGLPKIAIPKFSIVPVVMFILVSFATICEHIADQNSISNITGHDFLTNPGLNKTLMGDGFATAFASFFGGVPNCSYSESVGVSALSKVYSKYVIATGAAFLAILSFFPKISAIIQTIPGPVLGGISLILFGMISSSGLRVLVSSGIDYSDSKNLAISSVILVAGIGNLAFNLKLGNFMFGLSGIALATILGILLNILLPNRKK